MYKPPMTTMVCGAEKHVFPPRITVNGMNPKVDTEYIHPLINTACFLLPSSGH